jgi:hypothetical protein
VDGDSLRIDVAITGTMPRQFLGLSGETIHALAGKA